MPTENIIVADDHPIFRDGMCRIIADIIPGAAIGEAASMQEVLTQVDATGAPDIFFLDLLFPGMNPKETLPALRRKCPKSSIVIVSMIDDENTILKVMSYGADGYIVKSIAAAEMQVAIGKIRAGDYVIARPSLAALADQTPALGDMMDLTDRQREILALIAQGKSNKEIGRSLELSHFTIRNHVSLLFRIFKVQSRAELSRHATSLDDGLKLRN
jgi:DNA-binding NarL/FixJ family response regulator